MGYNTFLSLFKKPAGRVIIDFDKTSFNNAVSIGNTVFGIDRMIKHALNFFFYVHSLHHNSRRGVRCYVETEDGKKIEVPLYPRIYVDNMDSPFDNIDVKVEHQ